MKTSVIKSVQRMKQFAMLLMVVFAVQSGTAQSAFEKFDNQEDIRAVIVNKKMFALMAKMEVKDKEGQQFLALIKKLDNLKVFMTANTKRANEMKAEALKHIKNAGLEELMRVTEKGKSVRIYVRSGANESQVKELLMFIEGSGKEESVLMSLTGTFDLDELSTLTEKMNLPGGEALEKAGKK
ncbi:DUF4252 domain-containing protein [Flavobacterium sp.]|jgi:hypothetical protein|uniref:DUF4252 domain-containing protein n=1 Tax=Flavobacterium sp. TaxID=239 RepID=UPI0033900807